MGIKMKNSILSHTYQSQWKDKNLFDPNVKMNIGEKVRLHTEIDNVCSSAAACLNVMGNLNNHPNDLLNFLNSFDLKVQELISFPTGIQLDKEVYDDKGYVIFEWIGSSKSTINEVGGSRGQRRTSIDAFVLGKIDNKVTQILIEWKFTESYSAQEQLQRFAGLRGIERLRRYSSVLKKMRGEVFYPFQMKDEGGLGLYDLGYEPFYQLLRMHLLAKTTTPLELKDNLLVEDYRVVHLSHSENKELDILQNNQIKLCPGLSKYENQNLHTVWKENILSEYEREKFRSGYWDKNLSLISDTSLNDYLIKRYS